MQVVDVQWLKAFCDGVWIADGPPIKTFGFAFSSRMIVVKLSDGGVWINSPVEAPRAQMQSVAELGPVKHLVSPTPLHDWRLDAWAKVFPEAKIWTVRGTQHVLTGDAPADWAADIDQVIFTGSSVLNEAEFFHRASRTLIFCDFIQQYDPRPGKPLFNAFTKLAGLRDGGVPPDIRMSFMRNKPKGRESLAKVLAWDFDGFIPAHGNCIAHDAKPFVRKAFGWLATSVP